MISQNKLHSILFSNGASTEINNKIFYKTESDTFYCDEFLYSVKFSKKVINIRFSMNIQSFSDSVFFLLYGSMLYKGIICYFFGRKA